MIVIHLLIQLCNWFGMAEVQNDNHWMVSGNSALHSDKNILQYLQYKGLVLNGQVVSMFTNIMAEC